MNNLFSFEFNFNSDISSWDVSNVTDMRMECLKEHNHLTSL